MADWEKLCELDDIKDGGTKRVEVDEGAIALVRIGEDVYAIGDRCSHADISLSEGEVDPDDKTLECWKHGSTFSLEDGEPQTLPATRPVPVYEVRVVNNEVMVAL